MLPFSALALANPVLVEPPLPLDWTRVARHADVLLPNVRITLQQRNMASVKRRALDASIGGNGAKFYDRESLDALTAPQSEHIPAATSWLRLGGGA